MFLRRKFIYSSIIVMIFGTMHVSIVKADSKNVETKLGWAGIGASSMAIKDDGSLWKWNFSDSPVDLSNDIKKYDASIILVPTLVAGISDVKAVASSQGVSLALKKDGSVWFKGGWNSLVLGFVLWVLDIRQRMNLLLHFLQV
jgi:hypothetical protein